MKTKICSRCKIEKPITEFFIRSSRLNGYRSECKQCSKKYKNKYYFMKTTNKIYNDIICSICNIKKPKESFTKYRNGTYDTRCKSCNAKRMQKLRHDKGLQLPMNENLSCSSYIGVYVTEQIVKELLENIMSMPYGTHGYDFIRSDGKKIDAKCSKCFIDLNNPNRNPHWNFDIEKNTSTDYFCCIAFRNREKLTIAHIWLIPAHLINHHRGFSITDTPSILNKWKKYEIRI
jgi:hypothetical protein